MTNIPKVRLGLAAVSRDCFPIELSRRRRRAVKAACRKRKIPVFEIPTIVENEANALQALDELRAAGANALVLYLGNFGPEGPMTLLAQRFDGPVMFAAAAEESGKDLVEGRGDAYCGMLNASYNIGLRKLRPHIPEVPVGTADEVAAMIAGFVPGARIVLGLR
ncbi:MAG: fucose isomerase, partial [Candidatus Aminicenantes bacterium]|nr:fucose isomerase [Candidatus Aminicenantes bacterium]